MTEPSKDALAAAATLPTAEIIDSSAPSGKRVMYGLVYHQDVARLLDAYAAKARLEATKKWGEHEGVYEGTCGVHMLSHCPLCCEIAELERQAGIAK